MRLRIIVKTSHNNPEGHHEGDKYDTFLIYCDNSQLYDLLTNRDGYSRSTIVGVEVIKGDGCEVMESNPQQPQPAPVPKRSFFEEVENLCDWVENTWMGSHKDKTTSVRLALAAEKKREAELEPLLRHVVLWYKRKANKEDGADEILIHNIANYLRHTSHLDAFDKERGV